MTQHIPVPQSESNGTWLPLIEYSVKTGLSLSTIRRRIKSNSLQYRLEQGRYLILFEAPVKAPVLRTEVPVTREVPISRPEPIRNEKTEVDNAVKMISEAFEHALSEKDERIHLLEKENLALEERLNELRLLVKVLEEKYEVRY
jgi:hypothetical protein